MHFGVINETIKARRLGLNVTQEMLSELSGVSLRTLKKLESGQGNPTLRTLQKVAGVLGLEICLQVKNPPPEL